MPWHSEEVVFFGFEEGGGRGGACTSYKLFPACCCHLWSSKVCRGSLEKVKGDQCATSGKEKETGLS